ncbi:hypothetical protein [Actinomadura violacea]|uniref:Uncharacterized protein n=1 Tax=Actinomadura violacea TaxID=2819934 RepID=A0ABS3RTZ7_9ACTN|nr:hypothetical protein [Actinomadura violacea]MBO2460230.1 hypothetical protein [Actinomadura violacea]
MAPPETEYDKKGLLAEAHMWDDQATLLAKFNKEASSMTIEADGGRAFGDCVDLYRQNQQEIVRFTSQGTKVMEQITSALAGAARKYGATEEEIKAAIKNVGGRGSGGN